MGVERELKLIPTTSKLTREQVIAVLESKGFKVQSDGKTKHQEDTYYDDSKGTLERTGCSFRIRRKSDKIAITYKVPIQSETGHKERMEYEVEISSEEGQGLDLEKAKSFLRAQYPDLDFQVSDMQEVLTVINDRNKTNLLAPDGKTVLEMAFDSLAGKNVRGDKYKILPEIEFEMLNQEGDPNQLETVHGIITDAFPGQTRDNDLSKYARAKKEMQERELTVDEVTTCVLFSQVLNTTEFDKLKQKGQILHRYDQETLTNLDNFKDAKHMLNSIGAIKRGEYKFAIPRKIAEDKQMAPLVEGENYEVKDAITLEDMMCLLLSDMNDKLVEEVLIDFLHTNYYGLDDATTNRFSHSQQVMLTSGLLARKKEFGATFEERLTSMMSALFHDIGHVPMSHTLEEILNEMDGVFSHEINGKRTIDNICAETEEKMLEQLYTELPQMPKEFLRGRLEQKATDLKSGIANHSRKGSTKRIKGMNNQAPRVNDKICYVASDIADLIRYSKNIQKRDLDIISEEWVDMAVQKICGNDAAPERVKEVRTMLENKYIVYLRNGEYGRAIVNVVNSIERSPYEQEHFDVSPSIWKFIEAIIAQVKLTREDLERRQVTKRGIQAKGEMSKVAIDYIIEKLQDEYSENGGNIEQAWDNTLRDITKMGELDLLEKLRKKHEDKLLQQLATMTVIDPKDVPVEMLNTTRRIEECAYLSYVARGIPEEKAQEMAKKVGEETSKLTPQQVMTYFRKRKIKFIVPSKEEHQVDVLAIIDQLHDMADVQLKLKPAPDVSLAGICRQAGIELQSAGGIPSHMTDTYYKVKFADDLGTRYDAGMKVRETDGKATKVLVVKIPVDKNVPERTRRKYTIECPFDYDMTKMLEQFNKKYKGKVLELISDEPYEVLDIHRVSLMGTEGGFPIEISQDFFTGKDGVTLQEFELQCRSFPKRIIKARDRLKPKYEHAFVSKSKIDRIRTQREGERE